MSESRIGGGGLHARPAGSCPWTVYLYMTGSELRFFPDVITIDRGDGIVWKPIVLTGGVTVGRFQVDFVNESPFDMAHFSERSPFSGPATKVHSGVREYVYDIQVGETHYRGLKVILQGSSVGALRSKTVMVGHDNGNTVVDRPRIGIWRKTDEIEWRGEDPTVPIKVEFKNARSPFGWTQREHAEEVHSEKVRNDVEAQSTWHYTVTYGNYAPLDPDVEVDPPGGGGGDP